MLGGTDILRPAYDMFGDLWLIDRTSSGAKVLVVRGDQRTDALRVPGVTGADVAAFSVARDGSRLAVAYAGSRTALDRACTDVLRTDEGIVSGAGRAHLRCRRGPGPGSSTSAGATPRRWPCSAARRPRPVRSATSRPTAPRSTPASPDPSVFRGAAQALVVAPAAGPAPAADHPRPAAPTP